MFFFDLWASWSVLPANLVREYHLAATHSWADLGFCVFAFALTVLGNKLRFLHMLILRICITAITACLQQLLH